jgi:lipoate-protein ligase A
MSRVILPSQPELLLGPSPNSDEMATTHALLTAIGHNDHPPTLRIYRPGPTAAFSRRETHHPGYPSAVAAATRHGFHPVVRNTGGQAVVYSHGSLIVELIAPDPSPADHLRARFAAFGTVLAQALRTLGVDTSLGHLPGEFCPGDYSVLGSGKIKLAGTAQRLTAKAWLCSASIVVHNAAPLRAVLSDVYQALGVEWLPMTLGAVEDLVPSVSLDALESALVDACSVGW